MIALLTAIAHVLACVLDLGFCAQVVDTAHGPRCAVVAPRNSCPGAMYSPGWRMSLGTTICTSGCGDDAS